MPDAPSFPPQSQSISSTSGPSGLTGPISLEPNSRLPESLHEGGGCLPQTDKLFGALAGEGKVFHILQQLKNSVTLPSGQKVDPETFKSLVMSTAIPTNPT
jgi:hypothetical protein